ncbi:MAG: hypothetical protein DCC65_16335 [Planctomycetota bacterium]|nr:MAG: hypothetical protein DCC65_16335 [Planctomycetota bacterium]
MWHLPCATMKRVGGDLPDSGPLVAASIAVTRGVLAGVCISPDDIAHDGEGDGLKYYMCRMSFSAWRPPIGTCGASIGRCRPSIDACQESLGVCRSSFDLKLRF